MLQFAEHSPCVGFKIRSAIKGKKLLRGDGNVHGEGGGGARRPCTP